MAHTKNVSSGKRNGDPVVGVAALPVLMLKLSWKHADQLLAHDLLEGRRFCNTRRA